MKLVNHRFSIMEYFYYYVYRLYFVILVTVIGFIPLETVIKYTLLSNQKIPVIFTIQ